MNGDFEFAESWFNISNWTSMVIPVKSTCNKTSCTGVGAGGAGRSPYLFLNFDKKLVHYKGPQIFNENFQQKFHPN